MSARSPRAWPAPSRRAPQLARSAHWPALVLGALGFLLQLGVQLGVPSVAAACGGFFCNNAQPVNQAAERIVFAHHGDGRVTTVIEIMYAGPSEKFAWVLPMPGQPEVGISSGVLLDRLQTATNPQYQLNTVSSTCDPGSRGFGAVDGATSAGGGSDAGASGPVTVLDSGSVGPYDYVTITVDPAAVDPSDVAVRWLQDNGYDVSDSGRETLRPYLASGLNLIAFRLTKGSTAGAIRPIRLTYESALPMIPIRPTAVAANPNMGILVWVLGDVRAVPSNYFDLELNEARINWFAPATTYDALVTEAANEAGGQGFVTEQAGPTSVVADLLWAPGEQSSWGSFRNGTYESDLDLIDRATGLLGAYDGFREVLSAHVPVPTGIDPESFYRCPSCYLEPDPIEGFDRAAFIEALRERVIDPHRETAELFRVRPFMTRFYTTMSADEMTADPVFDFNAALPEKSNVHVANMTSFDCGARYRIELPGGGVVLGNNRSWPEVLLDTPANARVLQQSNSGEPMPVRDNTPAIESALGQTKWKPMPTRGGCSVNRTESSLAATLSMLMVAVLLHRRRRSGCKAKGGSAERQK